MMKYISPGSWFSLEYPSDWREFEDTEDSFLFYNPDKWMGKFSVYQLIREKVIHMHKSVLIMKCSKAVE